MPFSRCTAGCQPQRTPWRALTCTRCRRRRRPRTGRNSFSTHPARLKSAPSAAKTSWPSRLSLCWSRTRKSLFMSRPCHIDLCTSLTMPPWSCRSASNRPDLYLIFFISHHYYYYFYFVFLYCWSIAIVVWVFFFHVKYSVCAGCLDLICVWTSTVYLLVSVVGWRPILPEQVQLISEYLGNLLFAVFNVSKTKVNRFSFLFFSLLVYFFFFFHS